MRLGEVLYWWRTIMRITIRDMAAELGISAATLSRIENGQEMDGTTLAKILTWLMAPGERRRPR